MSSLGQKCLKLNFEYMVPDILARLAWISLKVLKMECSVSFSREEKLSSEDEERLNCYYNLLMDCVPADNSEWYWNLDSATGLHADMPKFKRKLIAVTYFTDRLRSEFYKILRELLDSNDEEKIKVVDTYHKKVSDCFIYVPTKD